MKKDRSLDFVIADNLRLNQILLNLLSNAIKYSERGEITLAVRPHKRHGNDGVIFSVSDQGIGIKKEDLPKLFEQFSQINPQEEEFIEGTGLGLALTKEFTLLHHGEVLVDSEYGEGSTFSIWIPQQ